VEAVFQAGDYSFSNPFSFLPRIASIREIPLIELSGWKGFGENTGLIF